MPNNSILFPFLLLFTFSLITPPVTSEIRSLHVTNDNRPMILFDKFGFTHKGFASVALSSVSVTAGLSQPDPSRLGFFLLSEGSLNQVLMELELNRIPCVVDSKFISLLFTFQDLAPPPHSSVNKSYPIGYPGEYFLLFANCNPGSVVTMDVRMELYNSDDGIHKDYLSAGQSPLPSLYFIFAVIYLWFLGFWIAKCRKNKLSVHRIHILMAVLLAVKALNLICASEEKHYIKVTGFSSPLQRLFSSAPLIDRSSHQRMDDACETSTKKNKKIKFVWTDVAFKEFVDACVLELRKGNRPGTHFNKVGWENIEKTMFEKTGKTLDKKQIKNKWDNMKKEWKLYDRLMRLETGIGGTRSLIDASPEWWEEKIKVNKDFAKFKDANLDIYETHYAVLFRDSVAVGDQAMTPSQFQKDTNIEGKGDSDEKSLGDDEPLFPSYIESSSSKRKKTKDVGKKRSTKSKTSTFEEKLDVVLDALSTKSTQTFPPINSSPTIADCMDIVITFPGFEEGSKDYSRALCVLIKKQNREAFMYPMTHEAKMELLKLLMEG